MNLKITSTVLFVISILLITSSKAFAQEGAPMNPTDSLGMEIHKINDDVQVLKRMKITGWIQAQYQHAESNNVFGFAGGNPAGVNYQDRFFIRRGRVKFTYDNEFSQYVMQIDANERNVTVRDFYAKFTDTWINAFSITMGLQNRPFSYEIQQSSSVRETPERSRFIQTLLPNERDLGAMLTVQLPKSSPLHFLKLDAGLFNGTGIFYEYDTKKDLCARLSGSHTTTNEKTSISYALSFYNGSVKQQTKNVYNEMATDSTGAKFLKLNNDSLANFGKFAKRQYIGADFQITRDFPFGIMSLRGEYIMGVQPGSAGNSNSPGFSTPTPGVTGTAGVPSGPTGDIYIRKVNGAYFYFVQNILRTPLQLVIKYDWYDPNINLAGNEIGKSKTTTAADIKYTTTGVGLNYRWNAHVKLMAYYDMVKNETSANLKGFESDIKDNILTFRVQYRF
jgi:hypothetical protein